MKLELESVSKRYRTALALEKVSFDVASGERVALVGPNGSGKSTLVRAVMGILRCEGSVRLDGQDPFRHRASLATQMAYVPQTAPRLGATVADVVRVVATLRSLEVDHVRALGAELELDVDELWQRPVRALSGGTRQKLLIALALAAPVSLLVMDEPTASLDHDARQAFFRLFDERAGEATLLLSSHRLDEVRRLVDRVVVLEEGRVVLDAPVGAPEVAKRMNGGGSWEGFSGSVGSAKERRAS